MTCSKIYDNKILVICCSHTVKHYVSRNNDSFLSMSSFMLLCFSKININNEVTALSLSSSEHATMHYALPAGTVQRKRTGLQCP
jgi:hypothetical protein